jgi:hypothetical protein
MYYGPSSCITVRSTQHSSTCTAADDSTQNTYPDNTMSKSYGKFPEDPIQYNDIYPNSRDHETIPPLYVEGDSMYTAILVSCTFWRME